MLGQSKKLFFEKQNKNIINSEQKWPLINSLIKNELISSIDLFFVKSIYPLASESVACFLAYLFMSFRNGHLCLNLEKILPGWESYENVLKQGAKDVPPHLLNQEQEQDKPLKFYKDHWYLIGNWKCETEVLHQWQRLASAEPEIVLPSHAIEEQLKNDPCLQEEQKKAIENGCRHSLSMIYGGPGTGKSYTASHLIKIIIKNLDSDKKANFSISLTAPTGKAASHLSAQVLKICPDLSSCCLFKAQTLHALVEKGHSDFLNADLLIVDESSMIDAHMMARLLSRVKSGTRLVFIGDPCQIPPVEVGNLFKDLSRYETKVPSVSLNVSLRHKNKSLENISSAIRNSTINDLIIHPLNEKAIIKKATQHFIFLPRMHQENLLNIFDSFKKFCLLCALRLGPFGSQRFNEGIHQEHIRLAKWHDEIAIPIIIVKNAPKQELYNGDLGILLEKQNCALFFDHAGSYRKIPRLFLPPFEYAYALTIHKSQGSEYDEVAIVLGDGSQSFGKEILYTAVTRARLNVEIFSEQKIIEAILAKEEQKVSNIKNRLL